MNGLRSISRNAIKRAESADPHSQHCLVENCSRTQAVQLAYVYNRNPTATSHILDSLEWAWGMRRGTLNLDTRRNIFFLGASLHELYKAKKWLLLPAEDVVFRYFDEERWGPLDRPEFPQIQGDTFTYKFLPLQDMEDIYVTRQSNDGPHKRVDVHHYPFDELPIITSHIHPKYAMLHLAETLRSLDDSLQDVLLERYPWFDDVQDLCLSWRSRIPDTFWRDPTFVGAPLTDTNKPLSCRSESTDNSPCTPLHRIRTINGQMPAQSLHLELASDSSSTDSSSSDSQLVPQHQIPRRSRKRPRSNETDDPQQPDNKRLLTSTALAKQKENDDLKSVKWTAERISGWAKECPTPSAACALEAALPLLLSPSPTPHPPSPTCQSQSREEAPLRRSARLKSKLKRV